MEKNLALPGRDALPRSNSHDQSLVKINLRLHRKLVMSRLERMLFFHWHFSDTSIEGLFIWSRVKPDISVNCYEFYSLCYFSHIGFCFFAQSTSKHKVTFLSSFWWPQMLFHCFRRHFELFIACAVQSILSRLVEISRLFTFIRTKIHPTLPGFRLP